MPSSYLIADDEGFDGPTVFQLQEPSIGWDAGGDPPGEPAGGLRAADWPAWAAREWPRACARLQVERVAGHVPTAGRRCRVAFVAGIVPTASVEARGDLVSVDGERRPVVWRWSHIYAAPDPADDACRTDPLDGRVRQVVLVRSRPSQAWALAPANAADLPAIARDRVLETCGDLDRFLGRQAGR